MTNTFIRNILILSASAGSGHNQAAAAVKNSIKNKFPYATVTVIDFMDGQNSYVNNMLKEGYLKMLEVFPDMYEFLYRWSQPPGRGSKVHYLLAQAMKKDMASIINKYQPDLMIFTHPFPCVAASYLKCKGKLNIPLVAVITDFSVHRLWIHNEIDIYFVATLDMKNALIQEGIISTKIHISGIPIAAQFALPFKSASVRNEFGLKSNQPIILLMGGGLGLGPVKQSLASLTKIHTKLQIIIVAGNNNKLRNNLEEYAAQISHHFVQVLGYTQRIKDLMAVSDILITKPGALTSSEALAMNLPMIFYQPLPGQEEENAAYLTGKNVACRVNNTTELNEMVNYLVNNKDILQQMKANAQQLRSPHASEAVVLGIKSFILEKTIFASNFNKATRREKWI